MEIVEMKEKYNYLTNYMEKMKTSTNINKIRFFSYFFILLFLKLIIETEYNILKLIFSLIIFLILTSLILQRLSNLILIKNNYHFFANFIACEKYLILRDGYKRVAKEITKNSNYNKNLPFAKYCTLTYNQVLKDYTQQLQIIDPYSKKL